MNSIFKIIQSFPHYRLLFYQNEEKHFDLLRKLEQSCEYSEIYTFIKWQNFYLDFPLLFLSLFKSTQKFSEVTDVEVANSSNYLQIYHNDENLLKSPRSFTVAKY